MKKILVAVSMAALLFASCSNYTANDKTDSAEVTAVASEAGVVVLSWEAVPDATGYTVTKKIPGTEDFQNVVSTVRTSNGRCYLVEAVEEKNADYTFKVVTNAGKTMVVSTSTEVSVTTPEEFKDVAFDASKIAIEKVPFTANNYNIKFPVDAGYNYTVKPVTANVDAKVAFGSTSEAYNYEGAKYIKQTKEVEGEEVVVPATVKSDLTVSGALPVYVVVKATPVNTAVAKAQYAISTVSVTAANTYGQATSVAATKESAEKARVTFSAPKVGKVDADPAKYAIYRSSVTYDDDLGTSTTTSALTKIGTAKKSNTTGSVSAVTYYYDDKIEAYTGKKTGKVDSYNYYVVYEGDDVTDSVWSAIATLDNTATGSNVAMKLAVAPQLSDAGSALLVESATGKTTNTFNVKLSSKNVNEVKVTYKAFATAAEANKAVAADLTETLTVVKTAGAAPAVTTSTDGATDSTSVTTDSWAGSLVLSAGQTVTSNATSSATSNTGAYYIIRAVAGDQVVVIKAAVKATTTAAGTTYERLYF